MVDFPPNLDDGELWLPSDILPDDRSTAKFPSEKTYMDELAQELSSFALRERNQSNPPPLLPSPNQTSVLEVRPPSRLGSVVFPLGQTGLGSGFNGRTAVRQGVYAYGFQGFRSGVPPGYLFPPSIQPACTHKIENFVEPRRRVLQCQQNLVQNRPSFPVQMNRLLLGGSARETGGTGVFLPRVGAIDARKNHGLKNEVNRCRQHPVKKAGVGKKEVMGPKAPTEKGLPQEWTY